MKRILIIGAIILLEYSCGTNTASQSKNHLSNASSPYLKEHADNPVDWYEWGEEALQKAKKENKPLLISVGYSACHWCHVMEKESFMDTAVARIMNENFVNIKVDREERPDIDNIYMNACQLLSGNGGWPLNAFALPDGKPFFAGTYYSKQSWIGLLGQIASAYKNKHNTVVQQAEGLTQGIGEDELAIRSDTQSTVISKKQYQLFFDSVHKNMDLLNGGLKGTPKFPSPAIGEFLLQYYYLTGNRMARDIVGNTLLAINRGLCDQVGGGFSRYATDSNWRVPHFEKMLYDNGQLLSLYSHFFQSFPLQKFITIINETAEFISREMTSPEGGFYSSIDADSKAGEGDYYAWELSEFKKIVSANKEESDLLADYYQMTSSGNWKDGKNLLYPSYNGDPFPFAQEKGKNQDEFLQLLTAAKYRLRGERNKRPQPSIDTKILTSWNAIMLKGFVDAFAATGEKTYLTKAQVNARFLEINMLGKDGHLWRNYKDGKASIDGFLDDYAWLASAYIRLYQLDFNKHWLDLAGRITEYAISNFYDSQSGLFYYTSAKSSDLVVRKMEISDNVIPSSNAKMAEVLYQLGIYLEKDDYSTKCKLMLSKVAGKMTGMTSYYAQWCYLAGLLSHGTFEVAIMGKDAFTKNLDIQRNYLPGNLFMGARDEENLPLLENKLVENKTLIYVCSDKVCKMPVEEVSKALDQLHRH
jgi:uncharacterized protein YyaL (SSP411 family)